MRKKSKVLLMVVFLISISFSGCSAGSKKVEPSKDNGRTMTDSEILEEIRKGDENIKTDILKAVDKSIDDEISKNQTLSNKEKNELKESITRSVLAQFPSSSGTLQPIINEYYSNTDEYVTNIQNTTDDSAQGQDDDNTSSVPKIEDGMNIPISFNLPYTYIQNNITFILESIEVRAYNHKNEPYREIAYPYEITITLAGRIEKNRKYDPNDSSVFPNAFPLKLEPHDTLIGIPDLQIDFENNTFTGNGTTTLNMIPKSVGISP